MGKIWPHTHVTMIPVKKLVFSGAGDLASQWARAMHSAMVKLSELAMFKRQGFISSFATSALAPQSCMRRSGTIPERKQLRRNGNLRTVLMSKSDVYLCSLSSMGSSK